MPFIQYHNCPWEEVLVIVSFFGYLGIVLRILKAEVQLSWTGGGLVFAQIVEDISSMRGCCFNKYFLQIYDTYSNPQFKGDIRKYCESDSRILVRSSNIGFVYTLFQFIIHVGEVVFIYYITYLFENLESFFVKIKHKTAISKIADSLAKITLEIYLVQMVVIDLCAEHLVFPLSFVVAVVGIYVYAIIVNAISTQIRRIVEKIVIRKKKAKI